MKGTRKIALCCNSEEELFELEAKASQIGVPAAIIEDAGYTQVAPGSKTVIGLGPAPSEIMDSLTGKLRLYR